MTIFFFFTVLNLPDPLNFDGFFTPFFGLLQAHPVADLNLFPLLFYLPHPRLVFALFCLSEYASRRKVWESSSDGH